ncbi:hypothetical protein ACEN4P_11135 [Marinilactibacillus psychrotolerans]|uniref:Transposase n=2 Tax=Marinilactibacillus psychrotolerans TaxID=191770 RepID=A0A5R9BX22_9LACT|nr:hypothetical protein [Marinilactibacillus psychrotolerans]TLQ05219.1 hypothetical protein FEZ48_12670 [Marinilactibacillus psychrotolerans]SJN43712.1 hypothetical protein FM115_10155 [Marinilactibacillus psychrotolerans 42ea]
MRSNNKHTMEELKNYILMYLHDGMSFKVLSEEYGLLLSYIAFNQKVLRFQEHDISGIQPSVNSTHYSSELKKLVILEHVEEGIPVTSIVSM